MNYGYSYNSKRVSQGPTFFNLRIMCSCVGRAIKRHGDFSRGGENWLLDDLAKEEDNMTFTYNFKDDLKVTTTKK